MEPDELPPDAPTPGDLTCEKCGASFDHTGRGRKPKTCPDCRKKRGGAPGEPKKPRGMAELERQIHGTLAVIGSAVAIFDPFDAQVILSKAGQGAKALTNLAAHNPAVRRTLEAGAELAGWGPVVMWGVQVSLPILAHHGFIRGVPDPAKAENGAV